MYKCIAILMMCLILGFFSLGFGQGIAEISYITNKGTAYLLSNPGVKLANRQELQASDFIVLENGAGVRILFSELQRSEKYKAPDTVSIAEEIKKLKTSQVPVNKIQQARSEAAKITRQYLKPTYTQYAGTRGIEIIKSAMLHDLILTFRRQPTIVVKGLYERQQIDIWSPPNTRLTAIAVDARPGIIVVPLQTVALNFNETYLWKVSNETQTGKIMVVSETDANEINHIVQMLEADALDNIEAAQSIAAYLFDKGFWTEAYTYVLKGLEIDSANQVLFNLQQAILSYQPEDIAYQEAIETSGELSLRYSFHIKHGNRLQEIYTGSTVHSGDMMQVRLVASEDCYLFLLNFDAGNKLYMLYPLKNQDHFLRGGCEIVFPEPGKYFLADKQIGEEKLFFIASKLPLDFLTLELNKYMSQTAIKQSPGKFVEGLSRGFNAIVDENGESVQYITQGFDNFNLSRLIKGKGLVVKEIVFNHIE